MTAHSINPSNANRSRIEPNSPGDSFELLKQVIGIVQSNVHNDGLLEEIAACLRAGIRGDDRIIALVNHLDDTLESRKAKVDVLFDSNEKAASPVESEPLGLSDAVAGAPTMSRARDAELIERSRSVSRQGSALEMESSYSVGDTLEEPDVSNSVPSGRESRTMDEPAIHFDTLMMPAKPLRSSATAFTTFTAIYALKRLQRRVRDQCQVKRDSFLRSLDITT